MLSLMSKSRKNTIIATSLALTLTLSAALDVVQVSAAESSSTQVTGNQAELRSRTLVPVRAASDLIGAHIEWNDTDRIVTISRGEIKVELTIGESRALINGEQVQISEAVIIKDQRAYVALDFLNSALGTELQWNAETLAFSFDEEDFAGLASSFISRLLAGDHEQLPAMMSDPLSLALPEQTLAMLSHQIPIVFGKPVKWLSADVRVNGVHTNVINVYETDRSPLAITVRFDRSGLIDDLSYAPASPEITYERPSYDRNNYTEQEVVIGQGELALPGTLTMPEGEGPFPAVVLVQGSGPHDRNSTIGGTQVFRDLAAGLASEGIAVLRYEKVTLEHTAKVSVIPTFTVKQESADDAIKAAALLRNTASIDPARIYVAGHSQGGYVMPMIIGDDTDNSIAGAILLSAPSSTFTDVLVEQQVNAIDRLKQLGAPDELIAQQEQAAAAYIGIAELVNNPDYSINNIPANFPLQPAYWWYDQRDYIPAEAAKAQQTPMLIVQGENDWQVSMAQFQGWQEALADRTEVKFISYPHVNHLLVEYEGVSIGMEYGEPNHVSASIIADIVEWVKAQAR